MRPLIRSGGKTIQGPQAVTEAPVDGKQYVRENGGWSETNFTQEEKAKLAGIAEEATKNRADSLNADKVHTHTTAQVVGLDSALESKASKTELTAGLGLKVDKVAGKGLSESDYTTAEKTKLAGVQAGATANATNAQLRDRATHTGVQPISSVTNLQSSLDSKVDKQNGYGLSQENYTPAEKSKLSSLEGSKFKGEYVSLAALVAAQPSPEVGSYAYVDIGVGEVVSKYIWDSSDAEWAKQQGETASLTPADVKSLYEGNPDTNAFSDSEKTKLAGIAVGATKNRADSANADKVHTHTTAQVTGLDTALSGKASNTDPRFTDAREWTAATVTQAEAEAGTVTTARKWTAQRVRQAIESWWSGSTDKTKLDGIAAGATANATDAQLRARSSHTGTQAISTIAGLDTALNGKVGTSDARLSDSRDWTAAVVTQAEAQAGTSTTERKWTAQRVAQAISALGLKIGTTASTAKAGNWTPTWSEVSSKPTTFTPASHTHSLSEVTDAGNLAALNTNASTANFLRGDGTWVTPPNTNTTYAEITAAEIDAGTASTLRTISGRRMKYALDKKSDTGHTHTWAQVTGQPATATRWPTFAEVTGKPTNYPPEAHDHDDRYVQLFSSNLSFEYISGGLTLRTMDNNADYILQARSSGQAPRFTVAHGAPELRGDGAGWTVNGHQLIDASKLQQTTGTSTTNVMSQKAVTDALATKAALNATATQQGGLKARLAGTTLYLTNNGTNP